MNKFVLLCALAVGVMGVQAEKLLVTFLGGRSDRPYDVVQLTFDGRAPYELAYDDVQRCGLNRINEWRSLCFADAVTFDLSDPTVQQKLPGVSYESFGLIRYLCGASFTPEFLHNMLCKVVQDGLDAQAPVLGCMSSLTLALQLALILGNAFDSPLADQLVSLALTDDYVHMTTPADLELIELLSKNEHSTHHIDTAYFYMLLPWWQVEKVLGDYVIGAVACSADGQHIACGSIGGTGVSIFNMRTGVCERNFGCGLDRVTHMAYSPSGCQLAIAGCNMEKNNDFLGVYDMEGAGLCIDIGNSERIFRCSPFESLAWSPDGLYLAYACRHGLQLWDSKDGAFVYHAVDSGDVNCVAWSPDGRHVASGGMGRCICIWDVTDSTELFRLKISTTAGVCCLAWSPDGRYLASVDMSGEICIWRAVDGERAEVLVGGKAAVYSVSWSPDGRYIVSGCGDKTVCLWNVFSHELLRTIKVDTRLREPYEPDRGVFSVTWLPQSNHVVCLCEQYAPVVVGAGIEFDMLNTVERWQMLAYHAQGQLRTRDEAVVAVRTLLAQRRASKESFGRLHAAEAAAKTVVDKLEALMQQGAAWQEVQNYVEQHEPEIAEHEALLARIENYIADKQGASNTAESSSGGTDAAATIICLMQENASYQEVKEYFTQHEKEIAEDENLVERIAKYVSQRKSETFTDSSVT